MAHLIAGSFVDLPMKLGKGKMNESEPKFPQERSKASSQGSSYTSEGSKPPSRVSSSDKVVSETGENNSSKSGVFPLENSSVSKEQVQSPPLVPTSGILSRVLSLSLPTPVRLSYFTLLIVTLM